MITIEFDKPNKLKCKQSAFLTSPYDLELIEAVRQLKERKWFDNRWEINAEKVDWLKSQLPNHTFNELGTKLVFEKKEEQFEFPKTKTTPKKHQLEGFNFMMNKSFVFQKGDKTSILKYFMLVIGQISVSALLVTLGNHLFPGVQLSLVKVVVDTILFMISYKIQKKYILTKKAGI